MHSCPTDLFLQASSSFNYISTTNARSHISSPSSPPHPSSTHRQPPHHSTLCGNPRYHDPRRQHPGRVRRHPDIYLGRWASRATKLTISWRLQTGWPGRSSTWHSRLSASWQAHLAFPSPPTTSSHPCQLPSLRSHRTLDVTLANLRSRTCRVVCPPPHRTPQADLPGVLPSFVPGPHRPRHPPAAPAADEMDMDEKPKSSPMSRRGGESPPPPEPPAPTTRCPQLDGLPKPRSEEGNMEAGLNPAQPTIVPAEVISFRSPRPRHRGKKPRRGATNTPWRQD